jgi:hypothetical protein
MNATELYTGLSALFRRLAQVHEKQARPRDGRYVFPAKGGTAGGVSGPMIHITSISAVGTDEIRSAYDAEIEIEDDTYEPDPENPEARLGGIVHSAAGNRRITLDVLVEAERQDRTALPFTERIRDRLALPSSARALDALGVSFQSATPTRTLDITRDKRPLSVYVFEVVLDGFSLESDEAVTTIETIDPEMVVEP